jgi:serine/threonine protein phosphatase 1
MKELMIDNKHDRIFVIGDIHGCALELNLLLQKLPLTTGSLIIFIGDYIDRGEDSKGVIDQIIKLKKTYDIVTLKGNHEQMFLDFYLDKGTILSK